MSNEIKVLNMALRYVMRMKVWSCQDRRLDLKPKGIIEHVL